MSEERETGISSPAAWALRGIGALLLVVFIAGGLALAYAFGMAQGLTGANPLPFPTQALWLPLLCLAPLVFCGFAMAMRLLVRPFGHPMMHGPFGFGRHCGPMGGRWHRRGWDADGEFPIPPMVEELHNRLHKTDTGKS